jgi:hypothetical protein
MAHFPADNGSNRKRPPGEGSSSRPGSARGKTNVRRVRPPEEESPEESLAATLGRALGPSLQRFTRGLKNVLGASEAPAGGQSGETSTEDQSLLSKPRLFAKKVFRNVVFYSASILSLYPLLIFRNKILIVLYLYLWTNICIAVAGFLDELLDLPRKKWEKGPAKADVKSGKKRRQGTRKKM